MDSFSQNYRTGLQFYESGHYNQALTFLKKALLQKPEFPDIYVLIARIYEDLERFEEARSMYERVCKLLPNDLELLLNYGKSLVKSGDEKNGIKILNKTIKKNPRDLQARMELGRLYLRSNKLSKALKYAKAGMKAVPDYAPFYALAGDVYRKQSKWTKAQNFYEKCLEVDPNYEPAKRGIDAVMRGLENKNGETSSQGDSSRDELVEAAELLAIEDYDEAITRLIDLKERPEIAREATLLLGMAFTRRGLFKRAKDTFESFLRHHKPDIRVLYNLGLSQNRMGLYDEAIPHLQQALEIDADFEEALIELGWACQQSGNLPKAREYYVRALRMDRENPRPYAFLAALAHERKDMSKVKEFLKLATQHGPDCNEINLVKGIMLTRDEKYQEAVAPFRACLQRTPDQFEALKNLGFCLLNLEDETGALECYQTAATLNPGDEECAEILRELQQVA